MPRPLPFAAVLALFLTLALGAPLASAVWPSASRSTSSRSTRWAASSNGPLELTSYPYFGDEIHSATAGTVVSVLDNVPETPPGSLPEGITAEKAGGNHVVVAIGGGRYAFYAHMQPGTVRVKVGQKLKVGQVLGLLGNSGNSDGPHLHFHIMSTPHPLEANGLPYRFSNFTVEGAVTNAEGIQEGEVAKIDPAGRGVRHDELPLDNQVIAFPEG